MQKYLTDAQETVSSNYLSKKGGIFYLLLLFAIHYRYYCFCTARHCFNEIDIKTSNLILKYDI